VLSSRFIAAVKPEIPAPIIAIFIIVFWVGSNF
jgi:hypothetical protein